MPLPGQRLLPETLGGGRVGQIRREGMRLAPEFRGKLLQARVDVDVVHGDACARF